VDVGHRLYQSELRRCLSAIPKHLPGQLDPIPRLCRMELRRLLGSVRGLCDLQLQLVVHLGRWLLQRVTRAMSVHSWIQMPVSDSTTSEEPLRPRYPIEGNALLIYRGDRVYAALEPKVVDRFTQLPNVRRLTSDEASNLEATLPGGGGSLTDRHMHPSQAAVDESSGHLGLGDAVSWLTSRMGIQECGACNRRRKKLNKIAIWPHKHAATD